MEQRLTTLCFWSFEPRKFKRAIQEHGREDASGGNNSPLVETWAHSGYMLTLWDYISRREH